MDWSKHFTLHPLVDLFIPMQSQLGKHSHAEITARRLLVHTSTTACNHLQRTVATWGEQNWQSLEIAAREPGFAWLRGAFLLQSSVAIYEVWNIYLHKAKNCQRLSGNLPNIKSICCLQCLVNQSSICITNRNASMSPVFLSNSLRQFLWNPYILLLYNAMQIRII